MKGEFDCGINQIPHIGKGCLHFAFGVLLGDHTIILCRPGKFGLVSLSGVCRLFGPVAVFPPKMRKGVRGLTRAPLGVLDFHALLGGVFEHPPSNSAPGPRSDTG